MIPLVLFAALAESHAADVQALGSPRWAERDAATQRLRAAVPLSLPAVVVGLDSPDLETRGRCRGLARVRPLVVLPPPIPEVMPGP